MRIIAELNRRGYRTKRRNAFSRNSLHDILKNEKYTGTFVFNRSAAKRDGRRNNHASKPPEKIIRLPGAVPAIISREDFRRVQGIMVQRKREPRPRARGEVVYILTGKVFCDCGAAVVGNSWKPGRGNKRYRIYECNRRTRTRQCPTKPIRKELLEDYVLGEIESRIFSEENIPSLARQICALARERAAESAEKRKRLEGRLAEVERRIEGLIDAIEEGGVDYQLLAGRLRRHKEEKEALAAELAELERRPGVEVTEEMVAAYLKARKTVIDRSDAQMCKKMVDAYVHRVTVYNDRIEVILKVDTPIPDNAGGGGPYLIPSGISRKGLFRWHKDMQL